MAEAKMSFFSLLLLALTASAEVKFQVQQFNIQPGTQTTSFQFNWTSGASGFDRQHFSNDISKILSGLPPQFAQSFNVTAISAQLTAQTAKGDTLFHKADAALDNDIGHNRFETLVSAPSSSNQQDADKQASQGRNTAELAKQISDKTAISSETFEIISNPDTIQGNASLQQAAEQLKAATQDEPCFFDSTKGTPCDPNAVFREPDGRCTNPQNPTWGMANAPYPRILPSFYEDGFKEVRKTGGVSKERLLSPRKISTVLTSTDVHLDKRGHSAEIMQFGQFMAHEFTLIPAEDDKTCCADTVFKQRFPNTVSTPAQLESIREEITTTRGSFCIPIQIPDDDPVFKGRCIEHIRTRPTPLDGCPPAPRQQTNAVTSVIDASAVYGSSKTQMDQLRTLSGGKLKSQIVRGEELPPKSDEPCSKLTACPFTAGDHRINTTPNLAAMHTHFLRKHNRVAEELAKINPKWDDERLFQETRKIIGAIQQNIVFNDYILNLLTDAQLDQFGLRPVPKGQFYSGFDAKVNPSILNEFAAAAFRYGHSLIDDFFTFGSDFLPLQSSFNKMDIIYDRGIKPSAEGLIKDTPWIQDRFFPPSMRDHLFDSELDIVSLNINRGRDHGLRTYVDYRKSYGLSVPTSWSDMSATHPSEVVTSLQQVYKEPGDIELYPGGVTETLSESGALGPLFGKILADQFSRSKKGDRFYFEGQGSKLTLAQIDSIRGYKLAKLICETANLDQIQPNAFNKESPSNSKQACSSLPSLDLSLWTDQGNEPQPTQQPVVIPTQQPQTLPTVLPLTPPTQQPPTRPTQQPPTRPTQQPPIPPPTKRPNGIECAFSEMPIGGCCKDQKTVLRICQLRPGCRCPTNPITTVPCTCDPNDRSCKNCVVSGKSQFQTRDQKEQDQEQQLTELLKDLLQ